MVTTHFYSEECVAAQLLHALMMGHYELAAQAASELYTSDALYLFRILCLAWWLQPSDHLLQYARTQAFLTSDHHALFTSLVHSPFPLPDITTPVATTKSVSEVKKALKKRQTKLVFEAALAMTVEERRLLGIKQPFLDAIDATIFKPLEYRILEHACAALTAFPAVPPPAPPFKIFPRGKAGRVFSIEDVALTAWQVRKPHADDLRGNPIKLIPALTLFETEEDETAFYESFFPDDIPDEWPDTEIAKSHALDRHSIQAPRNIWRAAFLDIMD